jgi:hypothetical protein
MRRFYQNDTDLIAVWRGILWILALGHGGLMHVATISVYVWKVVNDTRLAVYTDPRIIPSAVLPG